MLWKMLWQPLGNRAVGNVPVEIWVSHIGADSMGAMGAIAPTAKKLWGRCPQFAPPPRILTCWSVRFTVSIAILAMIEIWLLVRSDCLNYGRFRRVVQTVSLTTTSLSISRTEVINHIWHLKPAPSGDCPKSCFACLTRLALADRTLAQRLLSRRPLH